MVHSSQRRSATAEVHIVPHRPGVTVSRKSLLLPFAAAQVRAASMPDAPMSGRSGCGRRGGHNRYIAAAFLSVLAALLMTQATAQAARVAHNPNGRSLGVVRPLGTAKARPTPPANLAYNGGRVMGSVTPFLIYWEPAGFSFSARYQQVVDGFFVNVAADSGLTTNPYALAEQYADKFGATTSYDDRPYTVLSDTQSFPSNGCVVPKGYKRCLSDAQLSAEVDRLAAAGSLARGLGNVSFIFTPPGVAVCDSKGECFPKAICAYHSYFLSSGSSTTYYAVIPYPGGTTCDKGQHPNGDVADASVNLISHESVEAATDPSGTTWWDTSTGNEVADACNFKFGTTSGPRGARYTVTINGAHYYIQQQWSNRAHACQQVAPAEGVHSPNVDFNSTPADPAPNATITFDASASSPAALTGYQWDFGDGTTGTGLTTNHAFATAGSYTASVVVSDADSLIGAALHEIVVGSSAPPPGLSLAAGGLHTCAVDQGSGVACWGRDDYGQLGNGIIDCSNCAHPDPAAVAGLSGVTQVVGGVTHTCARLQDATVDCWGGNTYGQLGVASPGAATSPTPVPALSSVAEVTAGAFHSCARLSGGSVQCWGESQYGQLGDGSVGCECAHPALATVSGLTNAVQISAAQGGYSTCTRLADGTVKCWGYNQFGQLGNNSTTDSYTPVAVGLSSAATSVSTGAEHACAVLDTGAVECWGHNQYGQLGNNSTTDSSVPVPVSGVSDAVAVMSGYYHSCAILTDGSAACWGRGDRGQLGNNQSGAGVQSTTPVAVQGLGGPVTQLAAGAEHTCARLQTGAVQCWGRNDMGQVGDGSQFDRSLPIDVEPIP
jgi:alpha-tubulin suppressor-like RCC1 family protein